MKTTTIRCFLYAGILFMTPFAEKLSPVLSNNKWPTMQSLVLCALAGTIAAFIGVRAYIDGSFERAKTNGENKP
jgi:hypothetical protein